MTDVTGLTLLDRLRQSLEYEEPWTPRDVLGLARVNDVDFVCEGMNALPAVVALVEAARDAEPWLVRPSDVFPQQVERLGEIRVSLRAALAPFVGEAT